MRSTLLLLTLSLSACTTSNTVGTALDGSTDDGPVGGGGDGAVVPDGGGGGDGSSSGDGGGDGGQTGPFYSTCLEVANGSPNALQLVDGPFTLYVSKDPGKPWTAWCKDIKLPAPTEYLTLPQGIATNFSEHTFDPTTGKSDQTTYYSKLRIDPTTLQVDVSDRTFTTTSGIPGTNPIGQYYGIAQGDTNAVQGTGSIDLQGTPFTVAPNSFMLGGAAPVGGATYSANGQVVTLSVHGTPGVLSPKPPALQLLY